MKCHWSHDDEGNKFWYPGCYGGIYGPHNCTCTRIKIEPTEKQKDKKLIKALEHEIASLNRIIEKLKKQR